MKNPSETSLITESIRVTLSGETWSTPAVLQLPGRTLVVAADRAGTLQAFDGHGRRAWSLDLGAEITASPTLYDLDRDGRQEIVIGTHAGELFVVDAEGVIQRRVKFPDMIRSTPAIAELDGTITIFLGVYGPLLVALTAECKELWRQRLPNHLFGGRMKRGVVSSPLFADVDRDGEPELVVGIRSSRMFCVSARTGAIKWFARLGYDPDSSPSVTIDSTGRPLVLLGGGEHTGGDGDNAVLALDGRTGRRVWKTDVGGGVDSSPMLLHRSGQSPLLFVCSLARPAVLGLDGWSGKLLWRYSFGPTAHCAHAVDQRCRSPNGTYYTEHAICRSYTTPLIVDVDNDGVEEVIAGSNNGDLVILDARTGAMRQRVLTGGIVRGSELLADIDDDGLGEIVVPSGNQIIVYRSNCRSPGVTMFKARSDHLGNRDRLPDVVQAAVRRPALTLRISMFWHFVILDTVRHVLIKIDEKILRQIGLRLFRYGY